jgi:hypothetical protein
MQMWHPLQLIPEGLARWLAFGLLLAITVWLGMKTGGTPNTEAAPWGIVSLELAGNEKAAGTMIASWDDKGVRDALTSLYFDNFWLLVYSTTIALACVMTADMLYTPQSLKYNLGMVFAWVQWLAALLDRIENVALERMLRGAVESPWPQIAQWCAIPKFLLIIAGIAYVVIGLIVWLIALLRA